MREPVSGLEDGGLRLKTTASYPLFYGFEDGTVDSFSSPGALTASTNRAYEGTYSCYADVAEPTSPIATESPDATQGGANVSYFYWYFNEPSAQKGGGIRLWNSNGNLEMGVATDNPQWFINDGNGFNEVYGGDGYDRWVEVLITLNWGANAFDITITDLSTFSEYSDTGRPLVNGTDFEYFTIDGHNQGAWNSDSDYGMWVDNIEVGAP